MRTQQKESFAENRKRMQSMLVSTLGQMETDTDTDVQPAAQSAAAQAAIAAAPEPHKLNVHKDGLEPQFRIKAALIEGESVRDKLNNLSMMLDGKIAPTRKPFMRKMQLDDVTEAYIVIPVGDTESIAQAESLKVKHFDDDGTETSHPLQRLTSTEDNKEKARSVEVNSLRFNTTEGAVRAAFSRWGEIEFVRMRLSTSGKTASATVYFTSTVSVERLKDDGKTMVFIGNDTGRIIRRGTEMIPFKPTLDCKAVGLPAGCTANHLEEMNTKHGVAYINMFIHPQRHHRPREAYLSFTSQEAHDKFRAATFTINGNPVSIVPIEIKACLSCGSISHLIKDCEARTQQRQRIAVRKELTTRPVREIFSSNANNKRYNGPMPKAVVTVQSAARGATSYGNIVKQGLQTKAKANT
ncbi:hypothetical protein BGZ70_000079 [Mortierella alpina]|uniref:Uncharacterized protein n=1 Tax=Mortierella alpina TaxID=64518 RepID=A0A9P6M5Z4_MORAP|nr:hypothetical protein BGZ70_000079 [Mortierella alpina]